MSMITSRNTRSLKATNTADFIVLRRGPAGVAIEAHSREDEWESATAGAFDLDVLIRTLQMLALTPDEPAPAGSYTRTDEEVDPERARSIVQERDEWKARFLKGGDLFSRERARAEKAEQERDHLATVLATTARQRDEADKRNAHTLTPDAVTDEMVERFRSALHPQQRLAGFLVEAGLRAALTEPPTRRLEAERLDPIIDAAIRGHSDIASPTVVHAIADALAEEGVYVPEVGR